MVCSQCGQIFNSSQRPRELHCGHVLCGPCITLHVLNVNDPDSPCPQCRSEDLTVLLETRMATLTLEDIQGTTPVSGAHGGEGGRALRATEEDGGSVWDTCHLHGHPLSSWCKGCHCTVCDDCRELHQGQQHQVFEFRQARELLLCRYRHISRSFRDWLVRVQHVTLQALETAKSVVPVLKLTLSTVQSYMKEMWDQERRMVSASSLETMEDMLRKSFHWCTRNQPTVQRQVKEATATFQRVSSSLEELRLLQIQMEDRMAEAQAIVSSLEEERPRIIALPQVAVPFILTWPQEFLYVDLPESVALPYTTKMEFLDILKVPFSAFTVTYEDTDDALLFRISGDLSFDTFRTFCRDPSSGIDGPTNERKPSGLRNVTVHQLAIVEDHRGYEISLNGNLVIEVEKVGPERSLFSLCRRISVRVARAKNVIEVRDFCVTSGRNV